MVTRPAIPRCGVAVIAAYSSIVILICGSAAWAETGIASVYAYSGSKTASGERANPGALTGAHRTLPFGITGARHQQTQWP